MHWPGGRHDGGGDSHNLAAFPASGDDGDYDGGSQHAGAESQGAVGGGSGSSSGAAAGPLDLARSVSASQDDGGGSGSGSALASANSTGGNGGDGTVSASLDSQRQHLDDRLGDMLYGEDDDEGGMAAPSARQEQLPSSAALAAASGVDADDDPGLDHSIPPDDDGDAGPSIAWRPQSQQSTCEFTHTITDYAKKRESGCKKAEYSATTVDEHGNRWRLIVYVNGNGRASNHHLSLFLQVADADDLPFGWKKAVSYVLTLEHPSGANLGYAKRNPDKTFKLCPKAIDWGWSQFITSDRIQQEGYITDNTLTVRASVTVKSSSVSIDPEDAELYLKCAVEEGSADGVEACLAQGASVNCQFKDDLYTPLHTACSSTATEGSLEVLKLLLKRGADPNACNKWRETPLLIAANNGHRQAVEALLDNGADASLCSEAGWSALTFAAHKGYDDIVTLLLTAGAPVNCRVTEDFSTPLHKACAGSKDGHLQAAKLLIVGGADVHALNKWRETPLLTAANHGQADAVLALLRANADPCKCTDTGWSPLSIAAYKGHDEVVKLLLEEGAPTEEADPTLSALLQAATKGLPETVDLLLRHGADHTVTTKKGDTALSILVEQNLIDAAVDMVADYNASIARCSRDRKKVQRARLLINLRMKQYEKEGRTPGRRFNDDNDSEPDLSDEDANSPIHDSDVSPEAVAPVTSKKGKKKKKKKGSKSRAAAEADAKAAEEALLMELNEEESIAKKNEAAAASKRNKKKKKEKEREQKMQKEKEQREKEEAQAAEEERQRLAKLEAERLENAKREKEEMDAKKRELAKLQRKERERQEKARKEAKEREELDAKRRREDNDREKRMREQEKKDRERKKRLERKATEASAAANASKHEKLAQQQSKSAKKQQARNAPVVPPTQPQLASARNRGWEIKASSAPLPSSIGIPSPIAPRDMDSSVTPLASPRPDSSSRPTPPVSTRAPQIPTFHEGASASRSFSVDDQLEDMASGVLDFLGFDSSVMNSPPGNVSASLPIGSIGNSQQPVSAISSAAMSVQTSQTPLSEVELPAVSIFQQEKVTALLQRCAIARSSPPSPARDPMALIDQHSLKTVIYRWIVRASHESSPKLDSIIPSWTDTDMLAAYLQRQFISESRRGMGGNGGAGMVNMEVLKEAGSTLALLCHGLAKELAVFRDKCAQQLPPDWSDSTINFSASEVMGNDGKPVVVIDWAGRSQVYVTSSVFNKLRERFRGPPSRLLTAAFSAAKRYETKGLIISGTRFDYRLSSAAVATMGREANVTVELWTGCLSVHDKNAFCGVFADVDSHFGGLPPFGKEGGGGDEALVKYGGSVVMMPPLESTIASLYMRTALNSAELADANGVPLSFLMFFPAECFPTTATPSAADLVVLDRRLNDRHGIYVRRVDILPGGQHAFACGDGGNVSEVSQSSTLFVVLQNEAGKLRLPISDSSVGRILRSMIPGYVPQASKEAPPPLPSPSPAPPPIQDAIGAGFGGLGGGDIGLGGQVVGGGGLGGRRGRLFDLVDDGAEEEAGNDVDVMSGMLSNLNVDMFQSSSSQDIDIEAISLMGIGSGALGGNDALGRTSSRRF